MNSQQKIQMIHMEGFVTKNIEVSGKCEKNKQPDLDTSIKEEIKKLIENEMVLLPVPESGLTTPLGFDDNGNNEENDVIVQGGGVDTFFVYKAFVIGKHEVSYKLFYDVSVLAEKKGYKFANKEL